MSTSFDCLSFLVFRSVAAYRGGKDQRLTREAMMRYLQEHGDMVVSWNFLFTLLLFFFFLVLE
jgi:hypothetical protein